MDVADLDYPWLVERYTAGPFKLLPITLRSWRVLVLAQNPLIVGSKITAEAVVDFVWLHTAYPEVKRLPVDQAQAAMQKAKLDITTILAADVSVGGSLMPDIVAAVNMQFAQAMPNTSRSAPMWASVSVVASLVHDLASQYGWTPEYILELPMARLFQLTRCLVRDRIGEEAYNLRYAPRDSVANMSAAVAALNAQKKLTPKK